MKKLLAAFGFGSVAAFVALFLQVAHFGRNQLLFGDVADVEMDASSKLFGAVRFIYSMLYAGTVALGDYGLVVLAILIAAAATAVVIARPHWLDASLLAGISLAGLIAFWLLAAPWLLVSNVVQARALHPRELITGNAGMAAAAVENWSCLVCASVKETRLRTLACSQGHDPVSCAAHIQRRFAAAAGVTLLLVGALAYVILARGNWIDRASPGSGFTKATLAALSFVCVVVVALNVYAVGYVYGKTTQGFDFELVRQVSSDFTSAETFMIARTASAATLVFAVGDVQRVDIANDVRLEPAGKKNLMNELMTSIAEAEWTALQQNTFLRSTP